MAIDGFALDALPDLEANSTDRREPVGQFIGDHRTLLPSLYDRHAQAVFATAMQISRGSRDRPAEVVQETFLALWNRAEHFDPARGALPVWLQLRSPETGRSIACGPPANTNEPSPSRRSVVVGRTTGRPSSG